MIFLPRVVFSTVMDCLETFRREFQSECAEMQGLFSGVGFHLCSKGYWLSTPFLTSLRGITSSRKTATYHRIIVRELLGRIFGGS